jgi:hypothetical protein
MSLVFGLVIGFLISMVYTHEQPVFTTYSVKLDDVCRGGYTNHSAADQNKREIDRQPGEAFPLDFGLSQNPKIDFNANCQNEVPDGWADIGADMQEYSKPKSKYDIDGCIINGNVINPNRSAYDDDFYQEQQKRFGDDAYTAANLHLSRKPKEAFIHQSRWGVNSLRPYFAAELDDHANRIWYEDNPDLDQFM